VEITEMLQTFGFEIIDQFVLVQAGIPMMRLVPQRPARKNHSSLLVARFRR
jgi:hypothetical protein